MNPYRVVACLFRQLQGLDRIQSRRAAGPLLSAADSRPAERHETAPTAVADEGARPGPASESVEASTATGMYALGTDVAEWVDGTEQELRGLEQATIWLESDVEWGLDAVKSSPSSELDW